MINYMKKWGGEITLDRITTWKRMDWFKKVVNKLRKYGGFGWWEIYEVFGRRYELGSEYRSVRSWKEKIKMRNEKDWEDWEEEVSNKSTLKWYKLAKNSAEWRGI